jgi:GTPase SAR1 family protein
VQENDDDATLGDILKGGTKVRQDALAAINGLATSAESVAMTAEATRLRQTAADLGSDTFKILVMGRFNNGKSTLLNALMGGVTHPVDLHGAAGPLPCEDLPTTAILTSITYAPDPSVRAWHVDDTHEAWTMNRYLRESMIDDTLTREENLARFADIREFEMRYPAKLLRDGKITLYDSPGTDEADPRTAITKDASRRCDAAIIVFNSQAPMAQQELRDAAAALTDSTHVFAVMNLFHGRSADDRLRRNVWSRYVHEYQDGPQWNGQDPHVRDIFFVDAQKALDGRAARDTAKVAESGLLALELRLAEFLRNDRDSVHIARFAKQAINESLAVERRLRDRKKAVLADQEQLLKRYHQVLPKLSDIRHRAERLTELVERGREIALTTLRASLTINERNIRADLPGHLEGVELVTGMKIGAVFQPKKITNRANEAIKSFVGERRRTWQDETATAELRKGLNMVFDQISAEVLAIGKSLDELNLELTGTDEPTAYAQSVVGTTERVLASVAGLMFGNAAGAIAGGAGGWQGAAGGIGAAIGSFVILGLASASVTVFVPVMLIAPLLVGSYTGQLGLEKKVRTKSLASAVEHLTGEEETLLTGVANEVNRMYDQVFKEVQTEVMAVLDGEEQNIHAMAALNQADQTARAQTLVSLEEAENTIRKHRTELENATLISRQNIG